MSDQNQLSDPDSVGVFYNPAMTFNRELTIAFIKFFAKSNSKKLKVLEGLGATGLRSIRFAKEIGPEYLDQIICNDISQKSYQAIIENVRSHAVQDLVTANHGDAVDFLYSHRIPYDDRKKCCLKNKARNQADSRVKGFDVIDIDPFGSCIPFLDAAVQAIRNDGILCLTCTDMAVLSGSQMQSCYNYYHSWPVRTGQRKTCHEQGLRSLMHAVDSTAAKYGRSIVPLLSVSVDYYVRIFVQVKINKNLAALSCTKNGLYSVCKACGNFKCKRFSKNPTPGKFVSNDAVKLEGNCEICDGNFTVGGPYYLDSIFCGWGNEDFLFFSFLGSSRQLLFRGVQGRRKKGQKLAKFEDFFSGYSLPQTIVETNMCRIYLILR